MSLSTGLLNSLSGALPHLNFARHHDAGDVKHGSNHSHSETHQSYCTHRNTTSLTPTQLNSTVPVCPATDDAVSKCKGSGTIFSDKEACQDLCDLVAEGGNFHNATMLCFEEGCSDHEKHHDHNAAWSLAKVEEYREGCEKAGIDEKESSASGLGLKKGALVMALVFGSVFSGLLI
ncbi:hypothetical protein BJ508DRAFT_40712 [Ascobolus immersus RN42]|uniref:Uncharacterized protein n=1 Tax=Ascobolus immersus RN42 TaxID=1160509 RepID=A0A3N4HMA5_ASCIM|nr:hypothetical protein BJ508DRAFT_40712 [Ascobolus immersus RN42]